jgi:hypothetical protein
MASIIKSSLGIDNVAVLMGANVAIDVGQYFNQSYIELKLLIKLKIYLISIQLKDNMSKQL